MTYEQDDVKTWVVEWRLWGAVSLIVVLAWAAWCLTRMSFDTFWPLGAVVVWAGLLLAAPLWPSSRTGGGADGGSGNDPEGRRDA